MDYFQRVGFDWNNPDAVSAAMVDQLRKGRTYSQNAVLLGYTIGKILNQIGERRGRKFQPETFGFPAKFRQSYDDLGKTARSRWSYIAKWIPENKIHEIVNAARVNDRGHDPAKGGGRFDTGKEVSLNELMQIAGDAEATKESATRKRKDVAAAKQFNKDLVSAKNSKNLSRSYRLERCSFLDLDLSAPPARRGEKPDAIISDPPYLKEHVFGKKKGDPGLIRPFANWCFKVLAKDGVVAAMVGGLWQHEIVRIFESQGFRWRWTLNAVYEGGNWARIKHLKVLSCSKPILIFQRKGEMGGKVIEGDVVHCGKPAKDFHIWQQDVETFEQVVAHVTDTGDLVCDPFAATGTTGIACLNLKRRFIGSEIDPNTFEIGLMRLNKCAVEGKDWRNGPQPQRAAPTFDKKTGKRIWGKKIVVGEDINENGERNAGH